MHCLCQVFEGRDDIINEVKRYIENDSCVPLTIYGKSGCGKTSVMAKILDNCCKKVMWKFIVVHKIAF